MAGVGGGAGRWDARRVQPNPLYRIDEHEVRALIRRAPWMTLVSHPAGGPVASPSPVLLDDEAAPDDGIVLVTHLGRADARLHGLLAEAPEGGHRMLVVVQGEHGYVSPSWYLGADAGQVPTWNFEMATLQCAVEVVDADENLRVLRRLVAHFEGPDGVALDISDDDNRGLAMGTIGLRLRVTAFDAKSKMSQNKSAETRASVIAHLEPTHPRLAARMRDAI